MAKEQFRGRQAPPAQSRQGESDGANRPAHEVRLGRIKATVWRNASDAGPWFSVVIRRLYMEGSEWRQSESFGRDDLPLVAKVADMAHTWIYQQRQGTGESQQ